VFARKRANELYYDLRMNNTVQLGVLLRVTLWYSFFIVTQSFSRSYTEFSGKNSACNIIVSHNI